MRTKVYNYLFFFIVGTLYSFALSRAMVAATVLTVPASRCLVLCALFTLMFYLIFFNRYTVLAVLGGAALAALVAFLILWRQDFQAEWYLSLRALYRELNQFYHGLLPYKEEYSAILGTGICLFVTWLVSLNTVGHFSVPVLMLIGLGILFVPQGMAWGSSDSAAILMVFCFVAFLAKKMNLYAAGEEEEKAASKASAGFGIAAIPVSLAILLAAAALPKPDQLLDGISGSGGLREAADNLVYEVGGEQVKTFSDPGQTLGGPLEQEGGLVMEVTAEERLYLAGSYRDTYTGTSWEISQTKTRDLEEDGGRYLSSFYSDQMQEAQQYYMNYYGRNIKTVTVSLQENRMKSVLAPPFATSLTLPEGIAPKQNPLGAISLNKPLDRYSHYQQEYISWDYRSEYLIHYLLQGGADSLARQGLDEDSSQYLQLPGDLPPRVREAAEEWTQGAATDYDKVLALISQLRQFPYTLEPVTPPKGKDFVEHFLFEGQEGYCVYHATALAVLSRCVGVPARYVEGFALPSQPSANGNYMVTGQNAHAWAEVYFPGFGWVPFEATPPDYMGNMESFVPEPDPVPQPEPELPEPEPEIPQEPVEEPVPLPGPDDPEEAAPPEEPAGTINPLPAILIAALAVLLLSVLFLRVMMKVYRSRFGRIEAMDNREAVVAYFGRILRAADAGGHPLLGNETAQAYGIRVGDSLRFQGGALRMADLADIFSRAAYSQNQVTDQDRSTMARAYQELLRNLREFQMRGPRYFFNRFVLMRF